MASTAVESTTAARRRRPEEPAEDRVMRKWGPVDIVSAQQNRGVMVKLARYSLVMVTAPVGMFYVVRDMQPPEAKYRDALAAVTAILTVNIVIAAYVVEAFFFERDPPDSSAAAAADDRQQVKRLGRWEEPRVE